MIDTKLLKKHIYGISAIDCCDEYYWTGNYECFLYRPITNHNYYICVYAKRKNNKAVKWSANLYQTLSCSNSRDINISNLKNKTLKGLLEEIVNFINEYDIENKPVKMIDYMNEVKQPVFIIKDKNIIIIGTAYRNAALEMSRYNSNDKEEKDKWLYYHDDMPDYSKYRTFMTLGKSRGDIYIEKVVNMGCGYSAGGLLKSDFENIGLLREEIIEKVQDSFKNYLDRKYIIEIRQKV
jgi:hypothetical protein